MNEENINKQRVLVAPLDWGLGHATRCIPVIRELIRQGFDPVIAAEGQVEILLREEFPTLSFFSVPGYRIRYPNNSRWLVLGLIMQAPRLVKAIRSEKKWLGTQIVKQNIQLVISDNRYGMWHPLIPSIYITHQLHIETGIGWMNRIAQAINYRLIRKFTKCWIPDDAGSQNLGGLLSHPALKPAIAVEYIGALSRFSKGTRQKKINLLIVLSGVEPQRKIFEELLISQITRLQLTATIIRGLPGKANSFHAPPGIDIIPYANSRQLEDLLLSAKTVICRSGYSSVMDLCALGIRAILVPTPGQTEQEYLAAYLKKQQYFFSVGQKDFHLEDVLQKEGEFCYGNLNIPDNLLEAAIAKLRPLRPGEQ